jgi:hypothetical protein
MGGEIVAAPVRKHHAPTFAAMARYSWWLVGAIVVLLACINGAMMLSAYYRRVVELKARSQGKRSKNANIEGTKIDPAIVRTAAATFTFWQNVGHLSTLPGYMTGLTGNEVVWSCLYIAVSFFCSFYRGECRCYCERTSREALKRCLYNSQSSIASKHGEKLAGTLPFLRFRA